MKLKLKGRRFDTIEEIQVESQRVLDTLIEKDFQETFQKWRRRWDRCLHAGGNCFEGDMPYGKFYDFYSVSPENFDQPSCVCVCVCVYTHTKLREGVPYVKLYRYNPKHLYPKLNGYGDNGQRKVWTSCISAFYTPTAVSQDAPPTRSSDCVQSVRWLVLRRTSSTQRDKTVLYCC